ncbi:hypothetical protein RvY_14337 [Ramazzottius varieornatus]|uniref:Uncharacterized protein n=1 Tax=Ramazzottius varieornatus TaxID=947166 RepID=A0A1D1VW15_RAMVA|nr:hypothetical protein RvY_14337 [Ramazzottius varieornatus]
MLLAALDTIRKQNPKDKSAFISDVVYSVKTSAETAVSKILQSVIKTTVKPTVDVRSLDVELQFTVPLTVALKELLVYTTVRGELDTPGTTASVPSKSSH